MVFIADGECEMKGDPRVERSIIEGSIELVNVGKAVRPERPRLPGTFDRAASTEDEGANGDRG
jgi:hypothetical protein